MKRTIRRIVALTLMTLLIVNVAAIAFGADKPKEVQLRFSWWGSTSRHKATLQAIDAYTKKNPGVKIVGEYGDFSTYYQKLVTQLAGGTAADIIQIDYKWVHDLAAQGKLFVDVNKLKKQIDTSGFDMKFVKGNCAEGNYILGLPTGVNVFGMICNTNLLKQAGVDAGQDWDWDKLLDAGTKVQKLGKDKHLLYMKNIQFFYMTKIMLKQKIGKDFISNDYKLAFNRKQLVETFTYIQKLFDLGVVPPLEESILYENGGTEQIPNWLEGKYGISTNHASVLPAVIKASKFEVGVARYPVPKGAKNPALINAPSQILSINSKSPNINEAAKFINWMFNDPEAIVILSDCRGLPAVQKARDILANQKLIDPRVIKMVDQAMPYSGGAENAPSLSQEVQTMVIDYVQQIGYKKLTPEKAADAMIKDLTDKLKELKASSGATK